MEVEMDDPRAIGLVNDLNDIGQQSVKHRTCVVQSMQHKRPSHLEDALRSSLKRRRSQATIRRLTTTQANAIDFSSNDFLSLATSPELRQLYLHELQSGSNQGQLGSGGSRLLDGNSDYAERVERTIASFHQAESALLCNSGFDANVGIFSCLPQPGDIILYDEFIHASVHDGMRLSRASRCISFAHNDVSALRSIAEQLCIEDAALYTGQRNIFVALETVYSMDGDIAPLQEIVDCLSELFPERNAHIIVDEAHSTGLFGAQGRGLVHELGLQDAFLIRLHTFGKALAANGAAILCSPLVRDYLINYARPLIYTTFMSYPGLAAVKASYMYMMSGKTEPLARNVRHLSDYLHERLLEMEASLDLSVSHSQLLRVSADRPRTPIFAVLSSRSKDLAAHCQQQGLTVRGVVPPTVPIGTERIRICLHAGNTFDQIDRLVSVIRDWTVQQLHSHEARPRL